MGDPKRIRKKYKTPRQPFDTTRIETELQLIGKYGLRNMKYVWKHNTMLGNFRGTARHLLSLEETNRKIGEQELLGKLQRIGLLQKKATLNDVLSLQIEDVLARRLQTFVFKQGLACSPYHARQLITHGHITIHDRIIKSPGYLVPVSEEKHIAFSDVSPLKRAEHKALPANVYKAGQAPPQKRFESKRGKRPMPPAAPIRQTAKKIVEEEEQDVDIMAIAKEVEKEETEE